MRGQGIARLRQRVGRTSAFFAHDVWEARLDELPPERARLYRVARIAHSVLRAVFRGESLQVRAAALTYFTVLSLVPLLAFAFSLLKGFGAYDLLVEQSIRPFVLALLSGNPPLRQAFEQILGFVDATGVTSLGFVGLLTLLYAATRLLRNIEGALNETFSVEAGREPLQQLRDYVAIIVVTPICLMAGAALTTIGQALELVRAAGDTLGMRGVLDAMLETLGPLVVVVLGLFFLYLVMPNTRVRFVSAMAGALVGGLLWYLVLVAHVRFQVGVAQYNALYSGFGAIPIFLVWLQISWLMVLVGAQVAATHQHSGVLADRARMLHADQALKETLAISLALRIARAFLAGGGYPVRSQLSEQCAIPETLAAELLHQLERAGLVVPTGATSDPAYVLGRPLEQICVKDVLDALRRSLASEAQELRRMVGVESAASELWLRLDDRLARAPENRSLAQLLCPDDPEPLAPSAREEPTTH